MKKGHNECSLWKNNEETQEKEESENENGVNVETSKESNSRQSIVVGKGGRAIHQSLFV